MHMVTLTNALIVFAFGYVYALYNTSKHIGRKGGLEVVFRNDYGFVYEYTYQHSEYKIGTMNTKHAQCTCYTAKPIHTVFLLQAVHKIAPSQDFTAKPRHSCAVFTLWRCIPTHLPLYITFCLHHR